MDVLHVDMQDVPHQVCHFLMPLLNQVNNTMSPQNEYASTTWKYMHMMYSAEEGSKLCKKCRNNVVCWCFLRYFGALTATLFFDLKGCGDPVQQSIPWPVTLKASDRAALFNIMLNSLEVRKAEDAKDI